jgi:hypothetical protein
MMINHPDPQVTYIIAKFLTKGKQASSNPVHGYTRYSTPQPPPTWGKLLSGALMSQIKLHSSHA